MSAAVTRTKFRLQNAFEKQQILARATGFLL
jgi:hypothetical protein